MEALLGLPSTAWPPDGSLASPRTSRSTLTAAPTMSFRSRLTLFFVLIVIVPMVSVAIILSRLIADNERGKADARVAQGQIAVRGLYSREVDRAAIAAARIGRDGELARALLTGNRATATGRARFMLVRQRVRRISVVRDGRTLVDIGARDATASAAKSASFTSRALPYSVRTPSMLPS